MFSGADLVALIHEASIIAMKQRIEQKDKTIDHVPMHHFEVFIELKWVINLRNSGSNAQGQAISRGEGSGAVPHLQDTIHEERCGVDGELRRALLAVVGLNKGDGWEVYDSTISALGHRNNDHDLTA